MFFKQKNFNNRYNLTGRILFIFPLLLVLITQLTGCPKKGPSLGKDEYLIQRKFVVGDIDRYKSTMKISTKVRAFLTPMAKPVKVEMSLITTEEVMEDMGDGYFRIKENMEEVSMKITMGGKVLFDSNNIEKGEELPKPYQMLLELKEKGVEMEMNSRGQTRNTIGLEGFADSLQNADLTQMMEMSQLTYPAKPVRIGKPWTDKKEIPLDVGIITGKFEFNDTSLLEVVETFMNRRCALVKMNRVLTLDTGEQDLGLIGRVKLVGEGSMDIKYYFDLDAGKIVKTWGLGVFKIKGKALNAPGIGNVSISIKNEIEKVLIEPVM